MAYTYQINQLPANAAVQCYNIKTTLKAAGWVILGSSDGTSVGQNFAIDNITGGGTGANGMNNSGAWYWLKSPDNLKQIVVQRGTGGANTVWAQWDAGTGFTGPGSITTVPTTSATGRNWYGSSNAGTTWYTGVPRFYGAADNASPYGFWFAAFPLGGGTMTHLVMYDPLVAASVRAGDPDPYVVTWAYHASALVPNSGNGVGGGTIVTNGDLSSPLTTGGACWGYINTNWVNLNINTYMHANGATMVIPDFAGTDPTNGNDDLIPIPYSRRQVQTSGTPTVFGWKGFGTMWWFLSTDRLSGDVLNVNAAKDYIVIGKSYAFKWDGTTAPII